MRHCSMKMVLPVSKRGTVTLPPALRRKYGLEEEGALVIIEERSGELVLCPAMAVPLRDFDAEKMASWIKRDEEEMEAFLANEKKD